MKGQKFWARALNLVVLILGLFFFASPTCSAEAYTIGIVGIDSRVTDKNINLGDYTDLTQLEKSPLAHAQDIFQTNMMDVLPNVGLQAIDKTADATLKRMAEAIIQLECGDPSKAVKLFDQPLDYLIYGYITNITVTHRESIVSSNLIVRVDLSVRIVDASTGKIVCVATGKGESSSRGGAYRKAFILGGNEVSDICWNEALEKALDQVVDKIKKRV